MTATLRLRHISITGLFGSRDYEIELRQNSPLVLTGSNGTGKSTILRLINDIASGNAMGILRSPLNQAVLTFDNGPDFRVTRSNDGRLDVSWGKLKGTVAASKATEDLPQWVMDILQENSFQVETARDEILSYARMTSERPEDMYRIRREMELLENAPEKLVRSPDWLHKLARSFPILFISDQRLVTDHPAREDRLPGRLRRPKSRRLAIEAATLDIAERIRRADLEYARTAQQNERHFPNDVLESMTRKAAPSAAELGKLVQSVAAQREQLKSVGLLERDDRYVPAIDPQSLNAPHVRAVLAAIMRSTTTNYRPLLGLSKSLASYKAFLDARYFPKQVVFTKLEGIRIQLPNPDPMSGGALRASQLSSGEQQMAIIGYELVFRSTPGTLVVIDEPEISLHLNWQGSLIDDLLGLSGATNAYFMVATHSAEIVASHPEYEYSLDAPDE